MIIVRLDDTVRMRWTGMAYVACNTNGGNVSVRMGRDRGDTRDKTCNRMQIIESHSHQTKDDE